LVSLDEMEEMLNEIVATFPKALFNKLNGGIILLPEVKRNPKGKRNDLYILGQYHFGGGMGRYISIYYGSFNRVYGYLDKEGLRDRLIDTLKHEFIHHLESLAGERDLEIEDQENMARYLRDAD